VSLETAEVNKFHLDLVNAEVQDPFSVHHVLNGGMHGQKLHFDRILNDSLLFQQWIDITVAKIWDVYSEPPEVIIGVANGANRLARPVAKKLGGRVIGLTSKKIDRSQVILPPESSRRVKARKPDVVLVLDDVGTTGKSAESVALSALDGGAKSVEVLVTWQRREKLERLVGAGITYHSVIYQPLPTYLPEECEAHGFCADGWELVPYGINPQSNNYQEGK